MIELLDLIFAFIYGVVEGITEWLPISSTGHLILVEKLIPFRAVSDSFFEMFDVVIQLGAILAVVVLFWKKIWPFAFRKAEQKKRMRKGYTGAQVWAKTDILLLWVKIMISCVPAAVIGILFDDKIDELFYNPTSVAIALIVFGIAFIVVEIWNRGRAAKIDTLADITYMTAIMIGLFQVLAAVFPGTSRSGATIIGALIIGVSRSVAAEYTFFLAIPVMFGASLLKVLKFGLAFTGQEAAVLAVGCITAFVVSIFALKFLVSYVKKHDFKVFGYYRIVLGIIVLVCGFLKLI